jgi:hypothetical protein
MRFVPNPKFQQEIERQVEYRAEMVKDGEIVLHEAKAIAPVHTGAYRESLSVLIAGPKVYVRTTDFAGHMVEWGSQNNVAYAPIRRAVLAAGLRLDESQRAHIGQPGFTAVIRGVA